MILIYSDHDIIYSYVDEACNNRKFMITLINQMASVKTRGNKDIHWSINCER